MTFGVVFWVGVWLVLGAELLLLVVAIIGAVKETARRQRRDEESRQAELNSWRALNKAESLLLHVVGEAGWRQISECRYFEVPSRRTPGWTYRVFLSGVEIHDAAHFLGGICIAATSDLPWPDRLVTLILMARYQETRLLREGNLRWTAEGRASVGENWALPNQA